MLHSLNCLRGTTVETKQLYFVGDKVWARRHVSNTVATITPVTIVAFRCSLYSDLLVYTCEMSDGYRFEAYEDELANDPANLASKHDATRKVGN